MKAKPFKVYVARGNNKNILIVYFSVKHEAFRRNVFWNAAVRECTGTARGHTSLKE